MREATQATIIVSSDTHIGPRLQEDLRPYCPEGLREAFDAYAGAVVEMRQLLDGVDLGQLERNLRTDGHHDPHARLRDLDYDGVAAEVIFHGSQNFHPIPFSAQGSFLGDERQTDLALLAEGYRIYNRWLGEFCSVEPERHVGLAHLPMWDVDLAVAEARAAAEAGLRGVNFPAPKPHLLSYNRPEWEPFWSVCEELGLTLANHGGAGNPQGIDGPGGNEIMIAELAAVSRVSPMSQLIFGGVFERHPRLRLVLTELPGTWWPYTLNEFDSLWHLQTKTGRTDDRIPRLPSEYASEHVFVGASFQSQTEARAAVEGGYVANVCWGSDYPHVEGTWQYPTEDEDLPVTQVALRSTFAGLGPDDVRAMVGGNAVDAFGLDAAALGAVADRIGAPPVDDLLVPHDREPAYAGYLAFRSQGPWA